MAPGETTILDVVAPPGDQVYVKLPHPLTNDEAESVDEPGAQKIAGFAVILKFKVVKTPGTVKLFIADHGPDGGTAVLPPNHSLDLKKYV